MFIAALFMITKTWKQPRCPLVGGWRNRLCDVYTMEYCLAKKEKELWICIANLDESQRRYVE